MLPTVGRVTRTVRRLDYITSRNSEKNMRFLHTSASLWVAATWSKTSGLLWRGSGTT